MAHLVPLARLEFLDRKEREVGLCLFTQCEGPDGHPTLFGDVATGLGGAVRKNRAGDDGFHIKIYIYIYIYLHGD